MALPSEVFLSHSSHDAPEVARLADVLQKHGIPVFYSPHNIQGGQQWHDEIGSALMRCDWFVLMLSPDSVDSTWVDRELKFALSNERFEGRIVPTVLRPCDFSRWWVLPQLQMIDFRSDFDSGCRKLLRIWGVGFQQDRLKPD